MLEFPTVWEENRPDSLLNLSIKCCIQNPCTFCIFIPQCDEYELREGLSLPEEICERMLDLCTVDLNNERCEKLIRLFKDPKRTRLRRVNLSNSSITDDGIEIICRHSILELNISNCPKLSERSLTVINRLKPNLLSLVVGNSVEIFPRNEKFLMSNPWSPEVQVKEFDLIGDAESVNMNDSSMLSEQSETFILSAPRLRKLALEGLVMHEHTFFKCLLKDMPFLTYLDLSKCQDVGDLAYLKNLEHLTSLVLYNVQHLHRCVLSICQIKTLRHLDLSHSDERYAYYINPNKTLKYIVDNLENLVSLDISGTNLAGNRIQEREDSPADDPNRRVVEEMLQTDIPGLKSRVATPLEFLGLLNTKYEACYRHHIPAKRISGDANEEQILTAAQMYCGRSEMIQKVLNDLFHIFRFSSCNNIKLALDVVMEAMRLHIKEKHIQISGSASLFYIVKGEEKDRFNIKIKKRIIKTLLDAMLAHSSDVTMLRNGCLTLIHFKIPEDVFFEYERLVNLLLNIVGHDDQDEFVERIGVYLLNSLACQVDGIQKQLVGDRGAISIMLRLIENRLSHRLCDEVMETAWSTMWNVTDETPVNCQRFLEGKGMVLFLRCLQVFPDKPELLRNMMGLLGNVAEVKELRPCLMKDEYLTVFSDLLRSKSDGIEVSYNAAGILSHIASDGPDLWTNHSIGSVQRRDVLHRMVEAIEGWNLDTKRNINYRSFEPILRLLSVDHTPEAQHWAVWALANLTKVYPDKYCYLLKEEGGITVLKKLLNCPSYPRIYELANIIIEQCSRYDRDQSR